MENNKLNALGAFEDLKLFDSKGNRVYEFITGSNGNWIKYTYDSNGNELTHENSKGYWNKRTYDSNGNQLTFESSDGFWYKWTYDSKGNQLTHENKGYWSKNTYDSDGNKLTFEDSDGVKIGFNIPEFTMEQLVEKIGHNFKIKK
jgi:hypothetical protein